MPYTLYNTSVLVYGNGSFETFLDSDT